MRRFQSRRGNGRFQRNTLENTAGVSVQVCITCRRMNARPAGAPLLETCHTCGSPLDDVQRPTVEQMADHLGDYYGDR